MLGLWCSLSPTGGTEMWGGENNLTQPRDTAGIMVQRMDSKNALVYISGTDGAIYSIWYGPLHWYSPSFYPTFTFTFTFTFTSMFDVTVAM